MTTTKRLATFLVGDVFDRLAELPDSSVDLVVTSPPFLAYRSYLQVDHRHKDKEIGGEPTPAAFIDSLLAVTGELRRVLAPHGSLVVELGDTYSGSGGAGGDYLEGGWRDGQTQFAGSAKKDSGWAESKSRTLIPELFRVALAYGFNPLTGGRSPAGTWIIRNTVTWCRPNPPVGALADKWRPATSDLVVACTSKARFWDDIATRTRGGRLGGPRERDRQGRGRKTYERDSGQGKRANLSAEGTSEFGAPLLDWWKVSGTPFKGAHYAVMPPQLVEPLVKAMCPQRVCVTCGEPSRLVTEALHDKAANAQRRRVGGGNLSRADGGAGGFVPAKIVALEWSDCGHDSWRPGVVLDPFAGTGTTLSVATGHGHSAIGIDLDERNVKLVRERVGELFLDVYDIGDKYESGI